MKTTVQQTLSQKNSCVEFLFAYQQKNIEKMLALCNPNATVDFTPLGEYGKGTIDHLGRSIWSALMDSFPDIDNTLDAAIAEEADTVRCQVVIRGTQAKDFADIPNKGLYFDSDHIFIFHLDNENKIEGITITWDHADFKRQLGA
jgi:predicted ester cyclase